MRFEIIRRIEHVATIAAGTSVWYEAHGVGRRDMKIKRYVDEP